MACEGACRFHCDHPPPINTEPSGTHQQIKGIDRSRLATNRKHGSSLRQERGVENSGLAGLAVTAAHQYLIDPRMPLQAQTYREDCGWHQGLACWVKSPPSSQAQSRACSPGQRLHRQEEERTPLPHLEGYHTSRHAQAPDHLELAEIKHDDRPTSPCLPR